MYQDQALNSFSAFFNVGRQAALDERKLDMESRILQARQDAMRGDMSSLWTLDPEGASSMLRSQREQDDAKIRQQENLQKLDDAYAKRSIDNMRQSATARINLLSGLDGSTDPSKFNAVNQRLMGMGMQPVDADSLGPALDDAQRIVATLGDEKVGNDLQEVIQRRHGFGAVPRVMADPQLRSQAFADLSDLRNSEQQRKEKTAKAGASQITVAGNQPLEKTVTAKTQEGLISASEALDKLNSTLDTAKPEMFTYGAGTKAGITAIREKLGGTPSTISQQELDMRTRLIQQTEQAFNAYRKEITGAAASNQEIERLRKSFPNADQSWTQFRAAMDDYRRELSRKIRIGRKVLREGLDVSPDQRDSYIADLLQQGEQGNSPADRMARLVQLKNQGLTPEQAQQRMAAEGY